MGVMESYLPAVWLALIGFFLLYYAVADGSDLGIGILSLFRRDPEEAGHLMETIGHVWTGNQTWLLILGGMLFGAFPLFYSVLLSSLYIPMVTMVFGLVLRGVAFEFREHSPRPWFWLRVFGVGSLVATLAQGLALGGLLGGLAVAGGEFVGGVWDWWSGYTVLMTAGVLLGYVMLGANYLVQRTRGELRDQCYRYALGASLLTLGVSMGVHLATLARYPSVYRKWTTWSELPAVALPAALALVSYALLLESLVRRRVKAPLLWNVAVIFFSFLALSVGLYPNMIPSVVSPVAVHEAAASPQTLIFMLVVTAIVLPLILVYSYYTYRADERRDEAGSGY